MQSFISLGAAARGGAAAGVRGCNLSTRGSDKSMSIWRRNTGFAHYAMTISQRPLLPPFSAYNLLSEYISYSGKKLGQHMARKVMESAFLATQPRAGTRGGHVRIER